MDSKKKEKEKEIYLGFECTAEFVNGHFLSNIERLVLYIVAASKRTLYETKEIRKIIFRQFLKEMDE